jgi:hypothetical protein
MIYLQNLTLKKEVISNRKGDVIKMIEGSNLSQQAIISKIKQKVKLIRGLSRDDAAEYVGIGTTLFDRLVKTGRMPEGKKVEGRIIWDLHQIDKAMDNLFELGVDPFAAYEQHV